METLVAGSIFMVLVSGVLAIIYMLPWFIALMRGSKSTVGIFFTSLLFNWSIIGWFITFIWSIAGETKKSAQPNQVIIIRERNEKQNYSSIAFNLDGYNKYIL